ncbi:MAG TPA: hypothetical protein VKK79_19040 [Candidatus Lokiarchaeia archaeon]|nr:hypothetical protein [Candidatus Lokiarchaeia archaeon]
MELLHLLPNDLRSRVRAIGEVDFGGDNVWERQSVLFERFHVDHASDVHASAA